MTTITNPTIKELIHAAETLEAAGAFNSGWNGIHIVSVVGWLAYTKGYERHTEKFEYKGSSRTRTAYARCQGMRFFVLLTDAEYADLVERGEL